MKTSRILSVILTIMFLVSAIFSSSLTTYANDINADDFIPGVLKDDMIPVLDSGDPNFPCDIDEELPVAVDLSTSSSFPCVRDQGGIGSCAAWATTYYQFGYQVAAMNGWNSKDDTTKQFSPRFTHNLTNYGNNGGSYTPEVYDLLSVSGAVRYSEFTPTGISTNSSEFREWYTNTDGLKNALRYRISSYEKYTYSATGVDTPISSYNDPTLKPMKSLLNNGHVLVYTTDWSEWIDYNRLSSTYNTSHINEFVCTRQYGKNNSWSGHAMAIVGYDDNIKYDLNGDGVIQDFEKGAFKVVNSKGPTWKNNGFIWVMYDALNIKSNDADLNTDYRRPILDDYSYFVINVAEYPNDLTAEVTLTVTERDQVQLELGLSSINTTIIQQEKFTSLMNSGGKFNFSGTGTTVQTATIPFDFGTLVNYPTGWKNYYIKLVDLDETDNSVCTVVDKIEIVDSSGKIVVSDTDEKTIRDTTSCFRYMIGMVGDVDNSGSITAFDVTSIQSYLAQSTVLSNEALQVADVNGDGEVNTFDVTDIQLVLAQIEDGFVNGIYAELD